MATLKLTLDCRKTYGDGRHPVIFRLTSDQKSTSIYTETKLFPQEWDKKKGKVTKSHPDSKNLNLKLIKRQIDLEKKLLEITSAGEELSIVQIKKALLNKRGHGKTTFHEFATREIQLLREQGRFGNAVAYETSVNRFLKFAGNNIFLDQVNYTVISDFDSHLLKENLSRNTVAVYMREIRALLNKAIKKDLLDKNKYAFAHYKIKTERTASRAITRADLMKIKQYPLAEGCKMWNCRNIFFLIYNLIGINFADLAMLTKDNIQNGRIVYRRRKTGKMYSIKITEEAQRILNIYSNDRKYLITYFNHEAIAGMEERRILCQKFRICNKYLKKLGKLCELPIPLTSYVARYSWANVSKSLGYSKDLIAEALGHEYGNKITGIYLDNYGNEIIDEANIRVTHLEEALVLYEASKATS